MGPIFESYHTTSAMFKALLLWGVYTSLMTVMLTLFPIFEA